MFHFLEQCHVSQIVLKSLAYICQPPSSLNFAPLTDPLLIWTSKIFDGKLLEIVQMITTDSLMETTIVFWMVPSLTPMISLSKNGESQIDPQDQLLYYCSNSKYYISSCLFVAPHVIMIWAMLPFAKLLWTSLTEFIDESKDRTEHKKIKIQENQNIIVMLYYN